MYLMAEVDEMAHFLVVAPGTVVAALLGEDHVVSRSVIRLRKKTHVVLVVFQMSHKVVCVTNGFSSGGGQVLLREKEVLCSPFVLLSHSLVGSLASFIPVITVVLSAYLKVEGSISVQLGISYKTNKLSLVKSTILPPAFYVKDGVANLGTKSCVPRSSSLILLCALLFSFFFKYFLLKSTFLLFFVLSSLLSFQSYLLFFVLSFLLSSNSALNITSTSHNSK